MSRWQRYWFRSGGRTSAAVLRIAIGISIFWMLVRLSDGYASAPDASPHELYRKIGILKLWPGEPGATFFDLVWPIAWVSTALMIAGLASRASTAVSFVSAVAIASYEYSFMATWSHDNNAPLLAQLAFLGARGGDALSVDSLWRRWRGTERPVERSYQWSVQLVQLALGLMMASAAFSKLVAGGPTLAWALSDNLRNHILVRFDLSGLPRTPLAEWIIAEPWRWKLTAVLNIVAQLAPLVACFLVRRPAWRLAFGSLFAIETIALDHVMGFSNYHWLPLAVVFVDWEWLLGKLRRDEPRTQMIALPHRAARAFIVAFLVCDVAIAFWRWPKIDQRIGAYPLSNFPMFASIRARPPYDEHQLYEIVEGGFELVTEPPLHAPAKRWVEANINARFAHRVRDREELRGMLAFCGQEFAKAFPEFRVRAVRANLVALQAPAYPAPPGFHRVELATVAELREGGELATAFGAVVPVAGRWHVVPSVHALPPPDALAQHVHGAPVELPATRSGRAFVVDAPGRGWVLARIATPDGPRLFVVGAR